MSNEKKIEWKKCMNCGYLQHKSHLRCLNCKSKEFEFITSKGDCKLLTYTILTAPPKEFRDRKSYAIGVVEFDNGVRALGQLTTKDNLKIGMKLKAIYRKICDNLDGKEIHAYIYKPV